MSVTFPAPPISIPNIRSSVATISCTGGLKDTFVKDQQESFQRRVSEYLRCKVA